MIEYHYETDFNLGDETCYTDWITRILRGEGVTGKQIDYIFCSDEYLLNLNRKFLKHETFTDIITFDYSRDKQLSADIFISVERVKENAETWAEPFDRELLRVMAHGLLHMLGYEDKTAEQKKRIRKQEENKMALFRVEQ